jgi:hypothetical protein
MQNMSCSLDYFTVLKFLRILKNLLILGAFTKLRKATVSFVISLLPSARNNSTLTCQIFMKLEVWVFSENLLRIFEFRYNLTRIKGTLREDQRTFSIISRSIVLITGNISDKDCRENRNRHFVFESVFIKSCRLWNDVEKYCRADQATDDNTAHAYCMLVIWCYKCTVIICNTLFFHCNNCWTKAPEWMLHVHYLSCLKSWVKIQNSIMERKYKE